MSCNHRQVPSSSICLASPSGAPYASNLIMIHIHRNEQIHPVLRLDPTAPCTLPQPPLALRF
ncbi:hypothetical protein AMTR_s00077p00108320 [Amborella trichopoda]|uniref:Uncharacterized protein n=1 Tax=Amborella trichopoda TaxID=13333 RepID=W1PB08_AMBTC|nr:hypothetical protein AMTR_s00077p00108320 [Amborella trichopoda]